MKTIICGGRNYVLTRGDARWLDGLLETLPITEVVSSGALGADAGGEKWANARGIPIALFKADWATLGKSAGPIRNDRMAKYSDICIAFPGGSGTADMIRRATERGLRVIRRSAGSQALPHPD